MTDQPLSPFADGRDAGGRFLPGNPGGPGNPHAKRVSEFRSALLDAVTPDDLKAIVAKLIELAKGGNLDSAKLLFDRLLGKIPDSETMLNLGIQVNGQHQPSAEENTAMLRYWLEHDPDYLTYLRDKQLAETPA